MTAAWDPEADPWGGCRHGLPAAAFCPSCEAEGALPEEPAIDEEVAGPVVAVRAATSGGPRDGRTRSVPLGRLMARDLLRDRFIYVPQLGWHGWDGTRWQPQDEDHMLASAADWAEGHIVAQVRAGATRETVGALLKYRDVVMVRQLLAGARTDVQILVDAARLDARDGLLNCANGTVDLRTGALLPHDPAMLLTKTTGVAYRPGATHDDWAKALRALADEETAVWVQAHFGAAASGETDRSGPIAFHQGTGANGKTSIISAVTAAMGDYAALLPDKLLAGRGDEHDTLWMPLRGARLAYLEELPEDHVLPIARVKKLAETTTLTGRLIGRDYVSWPATHSLVVSTNYVPRVTETDHGTWRRLAMVPYPHTFRGADKDVTLKRRLKGRAQQEAVLAWIVDGTRRWYASGRDLPRLPGAMAEATAEWRDSGDAIAGFLRDQVVFTNNAADRLAMSALLDRFNADLPAGSRPWSQTLFSQRLKAHHMVTDAEGTGVNRGPRNRLPMALTGVAWARSWPSAQGAQTQSGGSHETIAIQNLWIDPAHPAREHETVPATPATPPGGSLSDLLAPCASCGLPSLTTPCTACRRATPTTTKEHPTHAR